MSNTSLFAILIGGLLVNNFVLSQFLGICPFLGVSKKLSSAVGMSLAVIFTTPTCPNCRLAVTMLDKQGFAYEKLNAEDNAELAKKYGVKQAPTLVVTDGEHFEKYAGAGAIKQYAVHAAQ